MLLDELPDLFPRDGNVGFPRALNEHDQGPGFPAEVEPQRKIGNQHIEQFLLLAHRRQRGRDPKPSHGHFASLAEQEHEICQVAFHRDVVHLAREGLIDRSGIDRVEQLLGLIRDGVADLGGEQIQRVVEQSRAGTDDVGRQRNQHRQHATLLQRL